MLTLIASVMIAAEPATVAFIGLGPAEATAEALRIASSDARATSEMLPPETLRLRLVGASTPHTPDVAGVTQLVADAAAHEARFDSVGARALRQQVTNAFDAATRLSPELRRAALTASLDGVAALSGDGMRDASEAVARDAVRRFGNLEVDTARYPPAVCAVLAAAELEVRAQPKARLDVRVDAPGRLFADGVVLGEISDRQSYELPIGSYRLWLVDGNGRSSLPYPVTVGSSPISVEIDTALDALIELEPTVAVRCEEACEPALQRLGRRLNVVAVVAVRPGSDDRVTGLRVETATGASSAWVLPDVTESVDGTAAAVTESPRRFGPLSLVPFGVGQFAQARPVLGASWATLETGLLAWHVVAWKRHSTSVNGHDFAREPELRRQRNLSAGLFYGAVVAGVIEAVVVGLVRSP
jgi:hypothetical protein